MLKMEKGYYSTDWGDKATTQAMVSQSMLKMEKGYYLSNTNFSEGAKVTSQSMLKMEKGYYFRV